MYNNNNCNSCDVESACGYEYKPCDCCNHRKFKAKSISRIKSEINEIEARCIKRQEARGNFGLPDYSYADRAKIALLENVLKQLGALSPNNQGDTRHE